MKATDFTGTPAGSIMLFPGNGRKPAELRAKILRYRELLRNADDPSLRSALRGLIRLTAEKLNSHDAAKPR